MNKPVAATATLLLICSCASQPAPTAMVSPAEPAPMTWAQERAHAVAELDRTFSRVYFGFDSHQLIPSTRQALAEAASIMSDYPEVTVLVEGHCDDRGSTEFNLALGELRAQSIKRYMVTAGIEAQRITTISYGEERPRDLWQGESGHAQNRRAEFRVTTTTHRWIHGTVGHADLTVAGLRN